MGSDNGDVGDALVHLVDAIRGHWIDGRESRRPLAGWTCADLAHMATAMAHGRLDNQDVLLAVYEESLGRILAGSGGDGRSGGRGATIAALTEASRPPKFPSSFGSRQGCICRRSSARCNASFPGAASHALLRGWMPAPGRTQQHARGGAGKRGVRCFFSQAWERVMTQWRVVGGLSLHNTVEVFTNKNRVYLS